MAVAAGRRTRGGRSVQLPNSADYAVAVMACHWLGAAVLPLNTQWRPVEVARNLRGSPLRRTPDSGPLGRKWGVEASASIGRGGSSPAPNPAERNQLETLSHGDLADIDALVLLTSGSSGPAKVVIRTQATLLANARHVGTELQWPTGCRILPVTHFFHANGFSNGLLLPLWSGGRIVLLRQFFPATLVDLIERERVQVVIGSPVVYETLLRHETRHGACQSLAYAISSSAALPTGLAEKFQRRFGMPVRELYGTSETGTIAIGRRGAPVPATAPGAPGPDDSRAGRPLRGVEVSILSEDGRPLPRGEVGAVAIRSPAVMRGYWTPEGIDAGRLPGGFYPTGDTGWLDADGELYLRGRSPRFLNIGGNKVSAGEVEQVLRGLPGVPRARVDVEGTPPQLVATLWLSEEAPWRPQEVLAHCRQHLAEYKIPRRFVVEKVRAGDLPGKHSVVVE